MAAFSFTGGDALERKLREVAERLGSAKNVAVGFLEDATYPDGTPVAQVAAINEFGGTVNVPAHTVTVYRQTNKAGTGFNKSGKFVKKSQSNFATEHQVEAHTVTIPPRPFFRNMVKDGKTHWGEDLGKILKENNYNAKKALRLMGKELKAELQESIRDFTSPGNAPSTIAKKGFDKPLIDTGHMLNSVDQEIIE